MAGRLKKVMGDRRAKRGGGGETFKRLLLNRLQKGSVFYFFCGRRYLAGTFKIVSRGRGEKRDFLFIWLLVVKKGEGQETYGLVKFRS